ncbi:hypothetical protein ACFQX6_08055 [Streptosporangium lutulentum]
MRRVSVVGISGSGKSTLATAIAGRLGVPWLELDSVFHMRDWTPRPIPEFRAEVDRFTSGEGWVVDGNYSAVRDLVWERADTVIWIDLPRHLVMRGCCPERCAGWPPARSCGTATKSRSASCWTRTSRSSVTPGRRTGPSATASSVPPPIPPTRT